jgi:hypothetical protein
MFPLPPLHNLNYHTIPLCSNLFKVTCRHHHRRGFMMGTNTVGARVSPLSGQKKGFFKMILFLRMEMPGRGWLGCRDHAVRVSVFALFFCKYSLRIVFLDGIERIPVALLTFFLMFSQIFTQAYNPSHQAAPRPLRICLALGKGSGARGDGLHRSHHGFERGRHSRKYA